MAIPATILPFPPLWDGEDCVGVAAAVAFGVEDLALAEPLAAGGNRPAEKRGIRG